MVDRWVNPCASNRAKREQMDAIVAQMRLLADPALSTLREVLTGADVPADVRLRAALAVLRGIGYMAPEPIGSVDPDKVQADQLGDQMSAELARFITGRADNGSREPRGGRPSRTVRSRCVAI